MATLSQAALGELVALARRSAEADEPPDTSSATRMWLVTQPVDATDQPSGVFLTEVHPWSRLLHTPAGLEYLTPADRELLGVAFQIDDLCLPAPVDLHESLMADLAADASGAAPLARSARWRLQRLAKQLVRAQADTKRWAVFVLRNEVALVDSSTFGVYLADGRRLAVWVGGADEHEVDPDDPFWDHNEFTAFARALVAGAVAGGGTPGPGAAPDVTLG